MEVFALWNAVGAYEGADVCVGIYSSYIKARAALLEFCHCTCDVEDCYITKVELDRNEFKNFGDAIGELI